MDSQERRGARWATANDFGLLEAVVGVLVGLVAESLFIGVYDGVGHHPSATTSFGALLLGLIGLWCGFVGAALVAARRHRGADAAGRSRLGDLGAAFGFSIRLWPDVPLGIVVGLASQYLLVPLLSLPLYPFVPHLYSRLGNPARTLTSGVHGPGVFVLGLFICLGSPLAEELYFRGLVFRGLLGRARRLGPVLGMVVSTLATGLLFGLAHFEALQFLGLAGFGAVLALLAWYLGRIGAGIVAHIAFNTVTFIAIVQLH